MVQAKLKVRGACCYGTVPEDVRVIHVSGSASHCVSAAYGTRASEVDAFLDASGTGAGDVRLIDRGPLSAVVHCACEESASCVSKTAAEAGATIIWPAVLTGGEESLTLLAHDRAHVREIVTRLEAVADVVVERVADVTPAALEVMVPLGDVTSGFTRKQLDVLRRAIDRGYYENPRRVSAADLARELDLSASAFHEHLRKAEKAVMQSFAKEVAQHPALADGATKKQGRPRKARDG